MTDKQQNSTPASGKPTPTKETATSIRTPSPTQRGTLITPQIANGTTKQAFSRGFGTGFGFMAGIGAVVAALTIISLISVMVMGAMGGSAQQTNSKSTLWGPANAKNQLLAIKIEGTIETTGTTSFGSSTYGYEVAKQLDDLKTNDYAGVVLLMGTPGGTISGARAIAEAIIRYQERTGHKVVAYVQTMSASGGMFAMAPADEIITDHGTLIGSIGVIMGPFQHYKDVTGTTGTLLQSGVTTSGGITSEYLTAGTGKDFGNPYREMTEQERTNYQAGLDAEYTAFVDFVARHRGIEADTIRNDLGAFMFDAQTAIDKGLADSMAARPDAFRRAAELNNADPEKTKVVTNAMPNGLASLLGAEQRVYGHNIPLSTKDGQVPTSELCSGSPHPTVFVGNPATVCGS